MSPAKTEFKWLYLFLLALIWGSSFILMKQGLKVYRPDQLATIRISVACVATFPFVMRRISEIPRGSWRYLAIVGISGSGIPAFLFAMAQTRIESSLAGILNGLTPMFTLLIGGLFFRSHFSLRQITGVMMGFAGASALIFFRTGGGFSSALVYPLLVVIATICYGISVNTIKAKLSGINALLISGASLLIVGVPYGIYLFTTDFVTRLNHAPGGATALGFIILLALMGTAVSNILYFQMVKISSPLFASAVTYLIPVVALGWGISDGELLRPVYLIAMIAILGGVALISSKPRAAGN